MDDLGPADASTAMRARHHDHYVAMTGAMVDRLFWSRSEIDAFRDRSFRALLRHVNAHSPWHAARLAHLDPETAVVADLATVEPMTKTDLMHNWDGIVTIPGATLEQAQAAIRSMTDHAYFHGDATLVSSGGTGGRPGVFAYDWDAMARNWSSMSRSLLPAMLRSRGFDGGDRTLVRRVASRIGRVSTGGSDAVRPPRCAAIGAERSAHGSYVMARIFSDPRNPTLLLSSWRGFDAIAPDLNAFRPEVLSIYPSMVPALAESVRTGRLSIEPGLVQFVSEHCSPANFALAQEIWPSAVLLSFWATSEAGATFPCPMGNGTSHVSEDLAVIEPIYAGVARPGRPSDGIHLTNLFNHALPIIRYHIDDMFEFDDAPCGCGSAYRTVTAVHGRSWEKFAYGDVLVHPLAVELAVLRQVGITAYQIRQTPGGVRILYVAAQEVDVEDLRGKAAAALASYGVVDPVVEVERVPAIERTSVGKLKRFVPLAA